MSDRVVIQSPNAVEHVDHECIKYHGGEGQFIRVNCDNAVYIRIWATKDGNVIVNIDHEEVEIEDAQIVESKIYRGHNDE